jgi:antitoxin (DNA-binding transcriptional repressor) of toxin-antitoxin stability system
MKTATVRDLRYGFPLIESWLKNGEQIEITKHGKALATMIPTSGKGHKPFKPNIMARLKVTWGDKVLSAAEVAQMHASEFKEDE